MPQTAPGSLSDAVSYNLVAFILSRNSYKVGDIAMTIWDEAATLSPAGGAEWCPSLYTLPLPELSNTALTATADTQNRGA